MSSKKLIEVALPLDKINEAAAYEKMPGIGFHPRGIHLWWARRPFTVARSVLWSSIVDDPSSNPDRFPDEESQNAERRRLFKILENLSDWKNSNSEYVLSQAREEILKATNGVLPSVLDPFAGGGAIPLEAQRLGLRAYAHDLNPVAVMINKAMIEIPSKFYGQPAVNASSKETLIGAFTTSESEHLASDILHYGSKLYHKAYKSVAHLYPTEKLPHEYGGGNAPVVAWIWARTVKCPNPACGCQAPLVSNYVLNKKQGRESWVTPQYDHDKLSFHMNHGPFPKSAENGSKFINDKGKGKKGVFLCPACKTSVITSSYIDDEANAGRLGRMPLAVVVEGQRGKYYLQADQNSSDYIDREVDRYYEALNIEAKVPHEKCRGTFASNAQGGRFGFFEFKDYFTKRQLISLVELSDALEEVCAEIEADAIKVGFTDDHLSLKDGGTGAKAYSEAIRIYLSFAIDRTADFSTSISRWAVTNEKAMNCFSKQAISMTWDYPEVNIFGNAVGSFMQIIEYISDCVKTLPYDGTIGVADQHDAQTDCGLRNVIVSTDPPYYDNICYSDLSDFFYVWLRKNVKDIYPSIFQTTLVPKVEELVATPYRFDNDATKAKNFFESGMLEACRQIYKYASDEYPVTIYYAYKQSDTDENNNTASSGWETMLSAIVNAGFSITGTWPMRTEQEYRTIGMGTNALASSIVLVCRKRPDNASQTTKKNFVNALRRELRPALKKLQDSNIAPVDLAQSAIGPGMGVFSKFKRVLEADGTPMTVRSALQVINEEIDLYFNDQIGSLDAASRFCVDLYTQCAYNNIKYGEAEVLAQAKNASISMMDSHGVLFAKAGIAHLVERENLPKEIDANENNIWLLTQQLTQTMDTGGVEACAKAVFDMFGSNAEYAKDLAYRLYTIAERKGWANEAYAYNSLVVAWPDIQTRAAELKQIKPEQLTLFDLQD